MESNLKYMIIDTIDEVVHLLRIGEYSSGQKELMNLIDSLISFIEAVRNQPMGSEIVFRVNEVLPYIMTTMQNKDNVYMCDILKYNLKPLIEGF